MAYNHNISVKVCGNPESSGGFGPILLLNNPSFVVEDQFYVGFDKNSFFFTITTYQTQTVYKLVKNNVRSSGAFRVGSLVIAISIPKNYKLEGGYTPYDVLCVLKDEFLKKCMTCKDPVRETYEYNAGKIDGHVLDEVVSKFTLTRFRTPDRVMTPNGPVGYIVETEEKIKELFQDINYPEFDKFKEVVVATDVHTTSYLPISNIQIPRPKKYELFVDGQWKRSCSNLNEKIPVECPNKSPLYYEELSREFSIQDLIDRPERHEGVVLDTVQEKVVVNTDSWGKPKKKKVSLAIFPEEDEDYFISYPQELKVTLFSSNSRTSKRVDVSQQGLVITLEGNEIAALKDDGIQVDTTPRSKYVVEKQEFVADILRVKVAQRKRPNPAPAGKLTVHVIFLEDKDLRGIRSVDLQAKASTDPRTLFRKDGVSVTWYPKEKCYKGTCNIQNNEDPGFRFFFVYSNQKADWKSNEISTTQKKPVATFEKIDRPFTDRYRKPLVCVLVTMMALVLGGLSFVLYNKLSNDDKQGVVGQGDFTEESIEPFLHNVDRLLRTEDLKFVTVDDLYDTYSKNKKSIDEYNQRKVDNRNICQRLCEYKTVINYIRTGQVNSIKEIVKNDKKYELLDTHRRLLAQIVTDETNEIIFRENRAQLKSFVGIMELYEKYGNDKGRTNINDTIGAIGESGSSDEEEVVSTTQKSRPKQIPVVNPIESKQGENKSVGKDYKKSSEPKEKKENRYTCKLCGPNMWFKTQKEHENHMKSIHGEE